MSIITTPSSVLSVLKLRGDPTLYGSHKLPIPPLIRKILQTRSNSSDSMEYKSLLFKMRDPDITDNEVSALLREANKCLPVLNNELRLFVQALSIIKWTQREDEVVELYQEFLNDLVSAHSQHAKVVIDELVKSFAYTEAGDWGDCEPVEDQKRQFDYIHKTLKSITERVPLSQDLLLECLTKNFPHYLMKYSLVFQLSYVYNLLKMTSYHPHLRFKILEIVIDKLLIRDVNSPREEILRLEEQQGETMYEMEIDDLPEMQRLRHAIADTLDGLLEMILRFIKKECHEGDKLIPVKSKKLFAEFITVFETVILPIHSHHIQFIAFYFCSFEDSLVDRFFKYLWTKTISPHVPTLVRQNSISYIAGLLARANYIPVGYLKKYLSKIGEWIDKYISNHCENLESCNDHSVFYTMCNAVFYLIAFRHEDLIDSNNRLSFTGLNITNIVTCKLNPLRACPSELLDHFACIASGYQLAYCYTIIENNARSSLRTVDSHGTVRSSITEMYYPFDPLLLPRSNAYIQPLYRTYNPAVRARMPASEEAKNTPNSLNSPPKEWVSSNFQSGLSYEN